jgi:hypothetical protein
MKRRLIASVAALALLYGTTRPAYALFGVGDIVFDPSAYAELVQEAKNGLQQIKWLTDIYGDTAKTLNTLMQFYNLFAHVTDATQLAQILNSQFLKSPMLTDALQLEQAFRGLGLQTSLAGKIQAIMSRIRYYTPPNTDFAGKHLNDRATATAGQLSSAEDAYTAATQRVTGLKLLQDGINTDDPKRVLDITARATIETGIAVAESNQLMAANLMQQSQRDAARQQLEQGWRYSQDKMRQQAQAAIAAADAGNVQLVTR